jgi:hypothetical protein
MTADQSADAGQLYTRARVSPTASQLSPRSWDSTPVGWSTPWTGGTVTDPAQRRITLHTQRDLVVTHRADEREAYSADGLAIRHCWRVNEYLLVTRLWFALVASHIEIIMGWNARLASAGNLASDPVTAKPYAIRL